MPPCLGRERKGFRLVIWSPTVSEKIMISSKYKIRNFHRTEFNMFLTAGGNLPGAFLSLRACVRNETDHVVR